MIQRYFKALAVAVAILFTLTTPIRAQDGGAVWVQIEALPTLSQAQGRVRDYAGRFQNVSGFALGSGWYGIALGPFAPDDADALLAQLRSSRQIPADSFIATGTTYRQQFWPIGAGAATTAQPVPDAAETAAPAASTTLIITDPETGERRTVDIGADVATPEDTPVEEETAALAPDVAPELPPAPPVIPEPDETAAEARASEALLTRPEREALQVALQWAGTYSGAIDGSYGRGTRGAMEAWQIANDHPVTGILTTAQRAELLGAYNAVLEGIDLQTMRDTATGIEMMVPTGVVAFDAYEPPFARFRPTTDFEVQVLFISQEGDQNRLFGLYEIMQTLEIVPTDGPRTRGSDSFELEGISDSLHSYTYAALDDGAIKGFTLVWPTGDEERRTRVLAAMRDSFTTINGVLDPAVAAPGEDQGIDLVSGLAVRKPKLSRSGFFVDDAGTVLTTTEAVQGCGHITLENDHRATVLAEDTALGLALLRPETPLAPLAVAAFQTGTPRLQSDIAVGGYPYGGVLARPSLTFGRLADLRGLNGEESIKRLALTAQAGDAGGPVFDASGAVLGMLMPRASDAGQVLPEDVSFSVDAGPILAMLETAGITAERSNGTSFMPPERMTREAADLTVLVSCWE